MERRDLTRACGVVGQSFRSLLLRQDLMSAATWLGVWFYTASVSEPRRRRVTDRPRHVHAYVM
jgi:hypothetical protein